MSSEKKYLTTAEAATYIGFQKSTLETLRYRGGGPMFYQVGQRAIRYTIEDLEAFVTPKRNTANPG